MSFLPVFPNLLLNLSLMLKLILKKNSDKIPDEDDKHRGVGSIWKILSGIERIAAMWAQKSNPTFNGKTITFLGKSYPAISGTYGNGSLPNGFYTGSNLRKRSVASFTDPNGLGLSVDLDLNFETKREYLRIHPDGGIPGTKG